MADEENVELDHAVEAPVETPVVEAEAPVAEQPVEVVEAPIEE